MHSYHFSYPEMRTFKIYSFSKFQIYARLVAQLYPALRDPHGLQHARLLRPWGFPRQEYWSGLACPPPEDLPNPAVEPRSPTLQADSLSVINCSHYAVHYISGVGKYKIDIL